MPLLRSLFFCLIWLASAASAAEVFPAGAPMRGPVSFIYAVYYATPPASKPLAVLAEVDARQGNKIKLVQSFPKELTQPLAVASWVDTAQKTYTPPDLQHIKYFGRGLTPAQAEALQQAQHVLSLEFAMPATPTYAGQQAADRLVLQVAEQTQGLIWDEETREIFTPDAWRKRHVDSWQGDTPNALTQTVIHAYQGDKMLRAITLGMAKFGLPDVVVNDFSRSNNAQVGNAIVALSQAMVEGQSVGQDGTVTLSLNKLKHEDVKSAQLHTSKPNAKPSVQLALYKSKPDQGDPQNRLLELGFERYPGPDRYARQVALFMELYGFSDDVQKIKHTDAILAASKAAKAKLPALRTAFNAGLKPGEYLLVKAPFATPDQRNEWMWVEVTQWRDKQITGLLNNEPAQIPTLHSGQIVKVSMDDVFDYIHRYGDGKEDGNETGKLMEAQYAGKKDAQSR
ncbi:DUF2314 domain-containing protein [Duganella sp. CY15W]|uniref:DUF2314 domain-containing protein n=1 Tax=Duganella sp. CY15W TaxID=2692172 RepID=UPI001367BDFF|nr:DUF2314 domain-containing protein [Duganella sp. CY15W]MYM29644.1 DUF2314 domain-containing protein [Duganella sp. CY15W]